MSKHGESDLYDTAPERSSAQAGRPKPDVRPSILAYQRAESSREFDPEVLRNLHAPLALFAGGLLVQFAFMYWRTRAQYVEEAIVLVISSVLMLVVFRLCAWRRGFQFGKVADATLKVLAISVAPTSLMQLLGLALWVVPFGWIVTWVIAASFYFALIGYFFELDQDDTWYCVIALFLTKVAVVFGAVLVIT